LETFQAFKDNGQILFDTNLICYGLVKSGYMALQSYWTRKQLRSAQLDPNDGANWTVSTASASPSFGDGLWGFTVSNAISPIVFITGTGIFNGTSVSGSSITFHYSSASTSTKFYCFDLMADNMSGTTFLKTYDTNGRITFNSLQPPLNIIAAIQAAGPGATYKYSRYLTCYSGGANRVRQIYQVVGGIVYTGQVDSFVDIPINSGVEYAAFLPWSRGVMYWDFLSRSEFYSFLNYSGLEGAYGRSGGISFMFGASPATTQAHPFNQGYSLPISFSNLPALLPTALVITTENLPFPFN